MSAWVKWIHCEVAADQVVAFAAAQAQWGRLAKLDGFVGQIGGWNAVVDADHEAESQHQACVIGLWGDADSYHAFMCDQHDTLAAANAQERTYRSCTTRLYAPVLELPGSEPDPAQALQATGWLRVAHCVVREDREEHFVNVQREVWNPGMKAAAGMLGGLFARATSTPGSHPRAAAATREYLVVSGWQEESSHRHYREQIFPQLRQRACPEDDLVSLRGYQLRPLPEWRVRGAG